MGGIFVGLEKKKKEEGKKEIGKKEVSADNNYMKKKLSYAHRKTRPHTSTKGIHTSSQFHLGYTS